MEMTMPDHDFTDLLELLASRLRENGMRMATAESCTGGWIAKVITDLPGSSDWFECGIVSYSNASKQKLLSVSANTIESYGAVSEQTAREMVQGLFEKTDADVGVSVSGIAGPGGGSADKPVGMVCFGFARRGGEIHTECLRFSGDREAVRLQSVKAALEFVLGIVTE